jgi:hypothetical protein
VQSIDLGSASVDIGFDAPSLSFARAGLDYEVFAARGPHRLHVAGVEAPLSGLHSLSKTEPGTELPQTAPPERDRTTAPSSRFLPLQRFHSPGSGIVGGLPTARQPASPGFLNLMTLSSARSIPALFHASHAHGVYPTELCSSRRRRHPSPVPLPSCHRNRHLKPRDLGRQSSQLPRICANAHPTSG